MIPKSLALHWSFLAALGVLVLNDHVLKKAFAGPVTGKLSDVSGLVVVPILAVATYELVRRRPATSRLAWWTAGVTGVLFTTIQTVHLAADAYTVVMGAARWALEGFGGAPTAVAHVTDTWDLLALPAVLVCPLLVHRRVMIEPRRLASYVSPERNQPSWLP